MLTGCRLFPISVNRPSDKLAHLVFRQDLTDTRTELLDGGCALVRPDLSQGRCGEIKQALPRMALVVSPAKSDC